MYSIFFNQVHLLPTVLLQLGNTSPPAMFFPGAGYEVFHLPVWDSLEAQVGGQKKHCIYSLAELSVPPDSYLLVVLCRHPLGRGHVYPGCEDCAALPCVRQGSPEEGSEKSFPRKLGRGWGTSRAAFWDPTPGTP